ncbi:MAG: energy-coupling factor transporter transmembrane protein EcfT [Treponema sp.]|jgi:cobalt/nickel transport system permease protein|nr:energy-coupling factor transporter transmembrane protein EcfT [Treponema sp.]
MYINRLEIDKSRFPLCLLNRLDARLRLVAGVVLIALAIQITDYKILLPVIVMCFVFLIPCGRVIISRLVPVNVFVLMLFVSLPLGDCLEAALNNTEPQYRNSLSNACLYAARINIAALLYMLFIIPMGISALSGALTKMRAPSKLISLLILTYRFIFIFSQRIFAAALSLRLRKPKTMPRSTELRAYAAMFSTAIISAELRSRKVMMAMKTKGFDGVFPVTAD